MSSFWTCRKRLWNVWREEKRFLWAMISWKRKAWSDWQGVRFFLERHPIEISMLQIWTTGKYRQNDSYAEKFSPTRGWASKRYTTTDWTRSLRRSQVHFHHDWSVLFLFRRLNRTQLHLQIYRSTFEIGSLIYLPTRNSVTYVLFVTVSASSVRFDCIEVIIVY